VSKIPFHIVPLSSLSVGPLFEVVQGQPIEFYLTRHPRLPYQVELCRRKIGDAEVYIPIDHRASRLQEQRIDLESVDRHEGTLDGTIRLRFATNRPMVPPGEYYICVEPLLVSVYILPRELGFGTIAC
jgi:hypothetical protein